MTDATHKPQKGFSGRLMGMKFMQRATSKLGKRKQQVDEQLSVGPPVNDDLVGDAAVVPPADTSILAYNCHKRCRIMVQNSVFGTSDLMLTGGRRSFAQRCDKVDEENVYGENAGPTEAEKKSSAAPEDCKNGSREATHVPDKRPHKRHRALHTDKQTANG